MKHKKLIFSLSALLILTLLITGGYFLNQYISLLTTDKSWIQDFNYQENELHDLVLNSQGCPVIPIATGGKEFPSIN